MARRLYRFLAHAFFEHRDVFDDFEEETAVTYRFHALAKEFSWMPDDQLIIPHPVPARGD